MDESLVQGNLHKLVQAEVNMGDFSTAERTQEYLLTKAYPNAIENETGDLEKLAEGLVGLSSLFVERMTGRGEYITVLAQFSALYRAVVLDIDALNRHLLERHSFGVESPDAGTLLHLAACSDAVNLGGLLISEGANVDHQLDSGATPLARVTFRKSERMVRLLLENEAMVYLVDDAGDTALHTACQRVRNPPYRDDTEFNEDVRLRIVEMLIEGGVNINAENRAAQTALFTAISYRHELLASYLLDMGAWIEIRNDRQKQGSRITAMGTNREPTLPLQMTPGVDPYTQARASAILHLAVEEGQHSVVRKLIDRGVDVNTIDTNCRTALENVQDVGDEEMMQMLVEAGAVGPSTDSDESE